MFRNATLLPPEGVVLLSLRNKIKCVPCEPEGFSLYDFSSIQIQDARYFYTWFIVCIIQTNSYIVYILRFHYCFTSSVAHFLDGEGERMRREKQYHNITKIYHCVSTVVSVSTHVMLCNIYTWCLLQNTEHYRLQYSIYVCNPNSIYYIANTAKVYGFE